MNPDTEENVFLQIYKSMFFAGHILDLRVISFLRSLKLPPTSPIYVYIPAEDVVMGIFHFKYKMVLTLNWRKVIVFNH